LCGGSKSILLKLHDPEAQAFDVIIAFIKKNCSTPPKLETCRKMLGGLTFTH